MNQNIQVPGFGTVLTIAPFVPQAHSNGHTYWFHKKLSEAFGSFGVCYLVAGPKHSSSEFVSGIFTGDSKKRIRLSYFPLFGLRNSVKSVVSLLMENPGPYLIHVYEGGIREFLLCALLQKRLDNAKFVFNFFLVDPWLQLLPINSRRPRLAVSFQKLFRSLNASTFYTFETLELQKKLELLPANPITEYPLFSSIDISNSQKTSRNVDVLFAPLGDRELLVCLESVKILNLRRQNKLIFSVHMRWGSNASLSLKHQVEQIGGRILESNLSQNEYAQSYSSSRVTVLPYQSIDHYAFQTSGRLLDAIKLGAKVIVPENTVLARVVKSLNAGSAFNPASSAELAQQIENLLQEDKAVVTAIPGPLESASTLLNLFAAIPHDKKPFSEQFTWKDECRVGFGLLTSSTKNFLVGCLYLSGLPLEKIISFLRS